MFVSCHDPISNKHQKYLTYHYFFNYNHKKNNYQWFFCKPWIWSIIFLVWEWNRKNSIEIAFLRHLENKKTAIFFGQRGFFCSIICAKSFSISLSLSWLQICSNKSKVIPTTTFKNIIYHPEKIIQQQWSSTTSLSLLRCCSSRLS